MTVEKSLGMTLLVSGWRAKDFVLGREGVVGAAGIICG